MAMGCVSVCKRLVSLLSLWVATTAVYAQVLPDTAYPSVKNIVYSVDRFDMETDPSVDSAEDLYSQVPGIAMFRGSQRRDAPFYGTVSGRPSKITVDWEFRTGYDGRPTKYGVWGGGTGWTGQPLFMRWPDSCMARFKNQSPGLTRDFDREEVIVGSLDAHVYFINYNTGKRSREPISVGNTIKGTPSLDPTLCGNLYVGQGIPCQSPFGALTIDLNKHKVSHFFPRDGKAWRGWNAYDSSPIRHGRFLFRPSENGTLYKFVIDGNRLRLHTTLRYKLPHKGTAAGMEASMSIYGNYGYVSDNHGNVLCVNLNTMQPVWHYWNHDDSDGSPVLAVEDGVPYIYTACEVDKQGEKGKCYFVKINALNGQLVWESTLEARRAHLGEQTFDGGMFATALLGKGDCEELIFTNIVTNDTPGMQGELVAFRRYDGLMAYRVPLQHYAWSSPVGLLNEQGDMFIFTADTRGRVYLIEGFTGEILCTAKVGTNFESSPIAVDNHIILGSRGTSIFKMSIQ